MNIRSSSRSIRNAGFKNSSAKVRSVCKLGRISSTISSMEPLESREMMSASLLAAPSLLSVTASSPTSVSLTWINNSTKDTGFKLLRAKPGSGFTVVAQINSAATLSYTDNKVVPNTAYIYELEAVGGKAVSAVSSKVNAVTPMAAPTGLTATNAATGVVLKWTDNDKSASSYQIFRESDGVHFLTLATVTSGSANTYTDKTAADGSAYAYEVEAVKSGNASPTSSTAVVTLPLIAPSHLAVAAVSASQMHLTWTDSDKAATAYKVLRSTDGVNYSTIATLSSGTSNSADDKTVSSSTTYYYEVEAATATMASAPSNSANAVTPLAVPTWVGQPVVGQGSIQLTWADSDAGAKGYVILQSIGTGAYSQVAQINSGKTFTWTDNSIKTDMKYSFEIEAVNGTVKSAASAALTMTTPLLSVTGLSANSSTGTSVQLTWMDNDSNATKYAIMRSVNGSALQTLTTVSGNTITSYTDSTVQSGHLYVYAVVAESGDTQSSNSNTATVMTPLLTPANLNASAIGTNVVLTWSNKDSQATGFIVMRSTDGVNYSQLVQLNSALVLSYTDSTAASGQQYFYEVKAIANNMSSPLSTAVSLTMSTPSNSSSVAITTRYSDELVIISTGTSDSIVLSQNGSTITILADGQTTTEPMPAAGVFIYTRGGHDAIGIGSSVTAPTTVETIDTGIDTITSAGTNVTVWDDSVDVFTGSGTAHSVSAFAGGVAKTTGASLANPSDAGNTMAITGSLWGTGPVATDINQGDAGDCYFLSSLAGFAGQQPSKLEQSAIDMGDGTYVVRFMNGSTSTYVRVSNSVSTYGGGQYVYARPGTDGDIWGSIMEKAFADYRTGANTYSSIDSGWMGDAYSLFGVKSNAFFPGSMTSTQVYNELSADLAAGKVVTLGTNNAPQLVSGHAYTLVSVSMVNGVAQYVVRNPWGVSGDSLENSQGYATLTFAQLQANFYDGCESV